jgi:hypothetical protein
MSSDSLSTTPSKTAAEWQAYKGFVQAANRCLCIERTSIYMGKILLTQAALLSGQTAGSIVRTDVQDTPETGDSLLQFDSLWHGIAGAAIVVAVPHRY